MHERDGAPQVATSRVLHSPAPEMAGVDRVSCSEETTPGAHVTERREWCGSLVSEMHGSDDVPEGATSCMLHSPAWDAAEVVVSGFAEPTIREAETGATRGRSGALRFLLSRTRCGAACAAALPAV